jgi:fatty-acid peroxygenase
MSGEEVALIFYDEHRFQRYDAVPSRMIKTLFGRGNALTMDGEAQEL